MLPPEHQLPGAHVASGEHARAVDCRLRQRVVSAAAHVAPEALSELIRVTRSGGAVVFTVRDDYWVTTGFANLVAALHTSGRVVIEQIRLEPYIHSEGSKCRFVVLTVL